MTEALVVHDPALAVPMKAEQLIARLQLIQEVQRRVMRKDEHYGKIPGTDKPTLYKPGAELLLVTFRLAAVAPVVEDLSGQDEVRYRVNVPIETPTGQVVAVGVGECSSREEKYCWRKPVYRSKEWEETPEDRRREVWKSSSNGAYKLKQVRTNPVDVANTILKMAHKRGLIHATLLSTGASSMFTQDLEDLPEEVRESMVDEPRASAPSEPQRKSQPVAPAGAAAKETPQPPAAAAPASPSTEFTRGVLIDKTEYAEKPQADGTVDKFYLVWAKKNRALVCFETRDQALYAAAATCEGSGEAFTIEFRREKRDNKPVFVMVGLTRDEEG